MIMLTVYPTPVQGAPPVWIDVFDPDETERKKIQADFGIEIPSRAALSEIESSSRLVNRDGLLRLSLPLIPSSDDGDPSPPPLGFILTSKLLVTVRFSEVHAIEQTKTLLTHVKPPNSADVFVTLLEAMVDYGADLLERLNEDVATISRQSFKKYAASSRGKARPGRLRSTLVVVGSVGERLSEIRDTLLGLERIAPFVSDTCKDWFGSDAVARLQTVRRDIASLTDFETHLSNKVQFLLDAVLGFINTEQNEIFKVLTIASVVGIPPTLIASMYGMNFKNMPELSWSWGYEYGLALIVVSTVLPILWFKSRGWW
jgi:magnesium transporter